MNPPMERKNSPMNLASFSLSSMAPSWCPITKINFFFFQTKKLITKNTTEETPATRYSTVHWPPFIYKVDNAEFSYISLHVYAYFLFKKMFIKSSKINSLRIIQYLPYNVYTINTRKIITIIPFIIKTKRKNIKIFIKFYTNLLSISKSYSKMEKITIIERW